MTTRKVKSDMNHIAKNLPPGASYADAMYELYVRMKITNGKKDADEGRTISHAEVKRKFTI